ncbi:MAG: N-6 DNA methylase [Planctomycetota bacterium]|nr:N-6 DNA methylase [Planctomycetota bacterium]
MSKLLELAHTRLGWPSEKDIMNPKGTGPHVIAELAKRKIETAIRRAGVNVNVGVLTGNPLSNKTEDPLAIVCDFPTSVNNEILHETHRLVWSFSRSPLLITVEPSLLRVWTCWKRPEEQKKDIGKLCVEKLEQELFNESSLSPQAAKALQWVELTSGSFFENPDYSKYFQRDQRADQLMLEDLKELRQRLLDADLPEDICHDLIARVIFIEFLFQRKDSQGNAALNEQILISMYEGKVLKKHYKDLAGIFEDHEDTYHFFRELNDRFNGDLFPGKGGTQEEREKEWKQEMQKVRVKPHLRLLADFVGGMMEIASGQHCLWQRYAFDAIPLEFVSSIYEEFLSKKKDKTTLGVHYTPAHIVDFILDAVLPWNSKEWNVKILDPACGSGIFLVKSYQRLIHRWKNAHGSEGKLTPQDLRDLLEKNLFGADINGHAVRVASFSLYLAMCDEIEPRFVWQQKVKFPRLRDRRLIESDFFREDKEGFRTEQDKETYDVVVGNAPWGHRTETEYARNWAVKHKWPISNKDIGMLFPCKSAILTKPTGRIALLQPAGALLFNSNSTAIKFRRRFFRTFGVERIVNLSPLRFGLFRHAVSPACIIILNPTSPSNEPLVYVCPKPKRTKEDEYSIVIEPYDINYVYPEEAIDDNLVWTVLAWGGRRDFALVRELRGDSFCTIKELRKQGILRIHNGFKRRKVGARNYHEARFLPVLEDHKIWDSSPRVIDAKWFPQNTNLMFERFRGLDIFTVPLIIIKGSWTIKDKRFKAVLVKGTPHSDKLLYAESFNGIQGGDECIIDTITIAMNSILSVYYFFLTGAELGSYRPKLLLHDILELPLPKKSVLSEIDLGHCTEDAIDLESKKLYGIKESEWVLIEDLFNYTLPDFKEGENSPGRQRTCEIRAKGGKSLEEGVLKDYCDYLTRVLRAGFGQGKQVSTTIFEERSQEHLPVRLVALHLDATAKPFIRLEKIDSQKLICLLRELDNKYLSTTTERARGGIFYQRVARVYDTVDIDGKKVPTIFIIKPDQVRYWTRSMAMRDADEIAGDIMLWQDSSEGTHRGGGK